MLATICLCVLHCWLNQKHTIHRVVNYQFSISWNGKKSETIINQQFAHSIQLPRKQTKRAKKNSVEKSKRNESGISERNA